MADPQLESLVKNLIADGASDEDIEFFIDQYQAKGGAADQGSVTRGAVNEVKDQVGAVKELLGATKDVAGHLLSGGDRAKSTLGGLWSGLMDGVRSLPIPGGVQPAGRGAGLSQLDPTGVSQIVGSAEPTRDKLGRGLVVAAETFGPLKAINKLKGAGKAGQVVKTHPSGARLVAGADSSTTGAATPSVIPPAGPLMASVPVKPKAAVVSGAGASTPSRIPTSQGFGTSAMAVPGSSRGTISVPAKAQAVPDLKAAQNARNALHRAEQEAEGRPTPYSEPSYGKDRRGPARLSDAQFEAVKARILAKEPSLPMGVASADDATRGVAAHAPNASRPPGGEGTGKRLSGLAVTTAQTKGQPTLSLKDMLAKYGAAEAAKRAGMSVDELEVRVAGASSADEVAAKLRDRIGADKAGRAVGLPAEEVRKLHGGPSRLPDKAVERIKAALAGKEPKDLTPREQALLDRIKNERGSVDPKLLAQLGLVGGGAAYGSTQTPEDPLVGALMGAGGGLLAGKALTNFPTLRREMLLAGGAIPKNIATGVGGVARAVIQGDASSRTAPIKEMLRIPTNIKKFQEGRKHPTQHDMGFVEQRKPTSFEWAPSRVISGIDTAFTDILKRAGMQPSDIEGYLLTRDNDTVKRFITNAAKQAGVPERVVRMVEKAGNFTFPFQRTPSNVGSEGFKEVGHLLAEPGKNRGRTAIALASPVIGWELAEWAKGDKQKMAIATVLMSALGPTSALAAAGAMPNLGFQSLGGVSPIPEWGFNPEKMTGLPLKFEKGRIKYDDPSPVKFWQKALGQDK